MTTERGARGPWPTLTYCGQPGCGRLEQLHDLKKSRKGGVVTEFRGGTDDGSCPGFVPGRVKERLPECEMDRRLEAVLALHRQTTEQTDVCVDLCSCGWRGAARQPGTPFDSCPTFRAARGVS